MAKRSISAEDLLKLAIVSDPQLDPAGSCILFALRTVGPKNQYLSHLYTVDLEGQVKQWTRGPQSASNGRWSPTGAEIAFIAARDVGGDTPRVAQIYLLPTTGGEARKLTALPEGDIAEIRWSPDGSKIAFLFRPRSPERTQKAKKEREAKGRSDPPWELDDIWYRLDGDGYFGADRFALWIADARSGKARQLYAGASNGIYSFDWSPDSRQLAVVHTVSKRPWADPPNDQIFLVNLQGKARLVPGLPKGEKGPIRWSPDGKWLAYLGDVDERDPWGVRNTKLYVVSPQGGPPTCLSKDSDYCLSASTISDCQDASHIGALQWTPDAQGIYVTVALHGSVQLGFAQLDRTVVELMTQGESCISLGNLSRDGEKIACTFATALQPPEVALIDLASPSAKPGVFVPKLLTDFNGKLLTKRRLSKPESVWLQSTDGVKVHTWVMKPIGFSARKKYPAVLEVHGGPHTQYGHMFFHEFQLLAASGYVVVFSNPRGSKGYGEAFCAAIRGDWGHKDWEDVRSVMRWMKRQPYIDAKRMGIMGGSYGGYMTNWAIGHTREFKAAITDRCVSNMVSMAGNSDFPFNKDGYFRGVPWGDLKAIRYLWQQSPIAYFEKVKTPTLIIHSEGDLRCNIEQAEQVFTALQQLGIESRFVRYPRNTFHGMSRSGPPDLRLHRLGEITKWWRRHLG